MIDTDNVLNTFITIARDGVGSYLSTVAGSASTTIPAVIKARQPNQPTPDYPYIQVDILPISQTSGHLLGAGVDENDEVYYETHYKMLLQYTVYGGNAISIAHELEAYFRLNSVLDFIENETTGTLEETFDVVPAPIKLATEWLEVASFNLTFNINDRYVNSADGVFDTINLAGEIKRNLDDPDPIPFTISETSNP